MTKPFDDRAVGHRRFRRLVGGAFVVIVMSAGMSAAVLQSSTTPPPPRNVSFEQCNGVGGGGGQTVSCDVTIVNTLTASADTTGSVVTINGGARILATDLVTVVNQCNGSGNGGNVVMACSVHITNNIAVDSPSAAVAATINQCNLNQANDGLSNVLEHVQPVPRGHHRRHDHPVQPLG